MSAAPVTPGGADHQPRPDFLIVCSDEQRWDTVGAYGPVYGLPGNPVLRTPRIDRLAAAGTLFDAAFTPYPLCSPTRATMWTALYPHQHDVLGNKRPMRLPAGFVTPVEAMRDAGYLTGYVGKWHVPGASPRELGFADARALGRDWGRDIDEYRAHLRTRGYRISDRTVENLTEEEVALLDLPDAPSAGTSALPLEDHLEPWLTDRTIELVDDAASSDAPFFIVVGYNAPHFPMFVPAPYDRAYDPADVPLPPSFDDPLEGKPAIHGERFSWTRVHHLSPDGWRKVIAHYWGLVSLVDDQVGRLVDALERLGRAESTIIVYTSDHGDLMGAHHLIEKGPWNVYEETVRLPMVIGDPRRPAGRVVPELVSQVDLLPTLLDLAGVPVPPGTAGRSLVPLMDGAADWRDALYGETAGLSQKPGVDPPLAQQDLDPEHLLIVKWLRTQRWKYAFYSTDRDELYDIVLDPSEMRNLASEPAYAELIRAFRRRLVAWMDETGDPLLPRLLPRLTA